jgi:hypothetical protein
MFNQEELVGMTLGVIPADEGYTKGFSNVILINPGRVRLIVERVRL